MGKEEKESGKQMKKTGSSGNNVKRRPYEPSVLK